MWHETAWTEPEPGPDLGPVQQVQVPNLGPEPNFGIATLEIGRSGARTDHHLTTSHLSITKIPLRAPSSTLWKWSGEGQSTTTGYFLHQPRKKTSKQT